MNAWTERFCGAVRAITPFFNMVNQLERRLRNELAARSIITNTLVRWYETLTVEEQDTSRGDRIGRKLVMSRKKEMAVERKLRMLLKKRKK